MSLGINQINHKFQSTLSVRRATICNYEVKLFIFISIHALREESDLFPPLLPFTFCISIHALREESDIKLLFHSSD